MSRPSRRSGQAPTPLPARGRSPRSIAELGRVVTDWGARHRRPLPWRLTRDPWRILVSEVMLQQTQAARVVEPYERFVARFPSVRDCAAAGRGAVVREWSGLGYNRRAANLHRSAVHIVERHGGSVPDDLAPLRALPGVGEYTARAVLAFAFEKDVGVVDTNVARVLARAVVGAPLGRVEAQRVADRMVPRGAGWAFNQAMFDLGAAHCTARSPRCTACPLRRRCRWAVARWQVADPALGAPGAPRRQAPFEGSDRQGRGRLVAALRVGPVDATGLATSAGWPDDPARALRVAEALVDEGLARWRPRGSLVLA